MHAVAQNSLLQTRDSCVAYIWGRDFRGLSSFRCVGEVRCSGNNSLWMGICGFGFGCGVPT